MLTKTQLFQNLVKRLTWSNLLRYLEAGINFVLLTGAILLLLVFYGSLLIITIISGFIENYTQKKVTADYFARQVISLEQGEYIHYGVLDSSTWARRGDVGPSIAETMIQNGCRWRPSDRSPKSRINGKLEVHKRFKVNNEEPGLRIFKTCRNLIRTLSTLPTDNKNPEDVDTNAEDHAYDALRYGCMSRPTHPKYAERFRTFFRQNDFHAADSKFGY